MKTRYSITFPPERIKKPVINTLIKDHNVEVNILNADISSGKTGRLVVELNGSESNLNKSLDFLKDQGIYYKQIKKELSIKEDHCIACGSCTGVCFSGALKLSERERKLDIQSEKCILCSLCVKACPLQIISLNQN